MSPYCIGRVTVGNIEIQLFHEDDNYTFSAFIMVNEGEEPKFNPKGFDGHSVPYTFKEEIREYLLKVVKAIEEGSTEA